MKKFRIDTSNYEPHNQSSDPPGVYSGFVLFALVMAALFLF